MGNNHIIFYRIVGSLETTSFYFEQRSAFEDECNLHRMCGMISAVCLLDFIFREFAFAEFVVSRSVFLNLSRRKVWEDGGCEIKLVIVLYFFLTGLEVFV